MELRERGPTSEVFLAWDTRMNQRVDLTRIPRIRRLDDEATWRRFLDLMRRLTSLQHPSLQVPTQFTPPTGDEAWFVTDHAEGERLRDVLDRTGRLPWRVATLLLHEVAMPLAWAHGHGAPHGRVGPERVVVEPTGRLTVGSFDVAARILLGAGGGPEDPASLYDDVPYLAPELLEGHGPTAKADLFSLGAMAWEMLVGQRLFAGPTDIRRHAQARRMAPDPGELVADLPMDLRRLVQALLAVEPERRPTDARFVRDKLHEILVAADLTDPRASLREWLERESRREGVPRFETQPGFKGAAGRAGPPRRGTSGPGPSPPTEPFMPTSAGPPAEASTEDAPATPAELWSEPATRHELPDRSPMRMAAMLVGLVVAAVLGLWVVFHETESPRQGDGEGTGAAAPPEQVAAASPSGRPAPAGVQVAEAPPQSTEEAFADKADGLLRVGNAPLAEEMARTGLARGDGDDPALKLALGRALAEQGRVDDGVRSLLEADQEVGATRGHVEAGFLLAQAGRCEEALSVFADAAGRGLDSAELHKLTGNCHLLVGQVEQAIDSLEVAASKSTGDLDVLLPLATALERAGRPEEARGVLEAALEVAPDERRIHVSLARIESVTGQGERALVRLDATEEADAPADPEALEVRAHAAFEAGRFAVAAKAYRRAIEAAGDEAAPDLVRNYAVALDRAGYADRAIDAYRRAVRAVPDDAEIAHRMGALLAAQGRHDEAVRAFEEASRRAPDRWEALFDKGVSELEAGRPADAAQTLAEVVGRRPSDEAALQNLGKAQVDAGQREAAVGTFERLAELRPGDPAPVLTMAALVQRMDRPEDVAELLREACRRGAREACE